jgi:intracellular septation protein
MSTVANSPGGGRRGLIRFALEVGPLAVFFIANGRWGVYTATAAFMVAMAITLVASWVVFRKLPVMPVVSGAFVFVFGGLTLYLQDELFIKLKPTIVNALFAAILFGGLLWRRPLLKPLLGAMMRIDDAGWRLLTIRWALFFVAMALLNELVWRNFSTEFWIGFKLFGNLPLTLAFALAQTPLILRHRLPDPAG